MLRVRLREALDVTRPGEPVRVWQDDRGRDLAFAEYRDGDPWMVFPGLAAFRLHSGAEPIDAFPDRDASPERVRGAFHKVVLPFALYLRGYELLHAGSVSTAAGVVAFVGMTRAGKSTFSWALATRGFGHWSDDALALDVGRGATTVPLPFEPGLRGDTRARLEVLGLTSGEDVRRPSERAPLVRIVALRRGASRVECRRLGMGDAVAEILTHVFAFDLDDRPRMARTTRRAMELAAGVGVVELCYPSGMEALPDVVDETIALLGLEIPEPVAAPAGTAP